MVLLTASQAVKAAIDEYQRLHSDANESDDALQLRLERLSKIDTGDSIEHSDLIDVSKYLRIESRKNRDRSAVPKKWRLDALLKGASIYQAPPPPKPEPSADYKALMQRLRKQEEEREYDRMLNPLPPKETFGQRFPNAAGASFNPNTYHGQTGVDDIDEATYQDVERQVMLIINVLVSIVACAVALWIVARHWSVPRRLALSLGGSLAVAAAEVAIYMGYIRRIQEAKSKEGKRIEKKDVSELWKIEKASSSAKAGAGDSVRHRKGKNR